MYLLYAVSKQIGQPSTCQQNIIRIAYRWWADGGPRVYAVWVSTAKYINKRVWVQYLMTGMESYNNCGRLRDAPQPASIKTILLKVVFPSGVFMFYTYYKSKVNYQLANSTQHTCSGTSSDMFWYHTAPYSTNLGTHTNLHSLPRLNN